jgi:hypothetical protein
MVERIRRPVTVALGGQLVPVPGTELRIEAARGEGNLYRDLAVLGRSDAAVARAASRWGLLASMSALLPALVPGLAESLASHRDGLSRDAASALAGGALPTQSRTELGAVGRGMEKILQIAIRRLTTAMGMSPEDLADLQLRVEQTDWSGMQSGADFVRVASRETEAFRVSHALPGEPQPPWAQDFDDAGDMSERLDRLGEAMDRLATSMNPVQRAGAVRHLLTFQPRIRMEEETTPGELAGVIGPLLALADRPVDGRTTTPPPGPSVVGMPEAAMALALLGYWQAGDSLAADGPVPLAVPRLGDVDTWRTVLAMAQAYKLASGETNGLLALVKSESAKDWSNFAVECALWRDAIDATVRADFGFEPMSDRDSLPGALRALERRLVSMQVVADDARPQLESDSVEESRERLLRWIAARCSGACVEPRPQSGIVGTEGRALWSIRDALTARPEARFCRWPECREPLPPGSYAHRKWCDHHLQELKRRRTAARRARGPTS